MKIAYVSNTSKIKNWDCDAMAGSYGRACKYFSSPPSNIEVVRDHSTAGQVVLLRDPGSDTTVIAFRGTNNLKHWLTNVHAIGKDPKDEWPLTHIGFDRAQDALMPEILNYLREHHGSRSTLMITGHSLGGALATLCAHELRSKGYVTGPIALVSFASPRVGFWPFRDHFASLFPTGAWRVTRPDDLVTQLPPSIDHLSPWVHVPREIYFSQKYGATRTCCHDAKGEDLQCSRSEQAKLHEKATYVSQHLSTPYMVTGDHVVSSGCNGVALQCSADSCEFPPSPPPAEKCDPQLVNPRCTEDCGKPGIWPEIGAKADAGTCYDCWTTSRLSKCPNNAHFKEVKVWWKVWTHFEAYHCCNRHPCNACDELAPLVPSSSCHPAGSHLTLEDGQPIAIERAAVGTLVKTDTGFQPILGFLHEEEEIVASYLRFTTPSASMAISPLHHAFVNGTETDPSHIKLGDLLHTPHGLEPVMRIEKLEARGAYHVIVKGGSYFVDGILASDYDGAVSRAVWPLVHAYVGARLWLRIPVIPSGKGLFPRHDWMSIMFVNAGVPLWAQQKVLTPLIVASSILTELANVAAEYFSAWFGTVAVAVAAVKAGGKLRA